MDCCFGATAGLSVKNPLPFRFRLPTPDQPLPANLSQAYLLSHPHSKPTHHQGFHSAPSSLFARIAELVALGLIGCLLMKRQDDSSLLCGVVQLHAFRGRPRLTRLPPPIQGDQQQLDHIQESLEKIRRQQEPFG